VLSAIWRDDADFEAKFDATLARVAPHVRRIIVIGLTPHLKAEVPQCIRVHDIAGCAIARSEFDIGQGATDIHKFFMAMAAKYPNMEYVDAEDFFCDRSVCPAVKDGMGLYWDSNHVTSSAARAFGQLWLKQNGGPGK
jgi:hypothetical protein